VLKFILIYVAKSIRALKFIQIYVAKSIHALKFIQIYVTKSIRALKFIRIYVAKSNCMLCPSKNVLEVDRYALYSAGYSRRQL
jgi:hypothetical protein